VATRETRFGRPLEGRSVLDSHKAPMTFVRWASEEGYEVDGKILGLKRPKVPEKEPTVFHINELRAILAACNKALPTEEGFEVDGKILGLKRPKVPEKEPTVFHINELRAILAACNKALPTEEQAVRILVGAGVRASELCGLAVVGPDGLPDLMTDSLTRGRVELRVRWNAGAKGQKSRRVPISPKLAAAIKRYEARQRPDASYPNLLINRLGRPYDRFGIDDIMDRLQTRVGFRVHAHGFRHTFATVTTKLGWNLEHLRAAMGHADYKVLQHYVRLATARDLGGRQEWLEFVAANPALDWS
jgi:integrase